jgi:signal transduction histidine kinase
MNKFFFPKWLRDLSISRKLYLIVGVMAVLIAIELMTMMFAVRTLSSVRAMVGAEGLWSKAQKDAVTCIQQYGINRQEKEYQEFLSFLKVPQSYTKVREEMAKESPDFNIVRQGFIDGRTHADDIDGALDLFRRFHKIYYVNQATDLWIKGDTLLMQLAALGEDLHKEVNSPSPSAERINALLSQIDPLNEQLTRLEDEFSFTLGAGSRWLTDLIMKLLLGLVLTVEISGLSLTIFVSRGIAKGLNAIIVSSDRIAKGDYGARAKVYSKDEIGVLAESFNAMTEKLQQTITALRRSEDELNKSKAVAEQSSVTKDLFLANMSHEIRTPMNAVIGFTHLLEGTNLDEEQGQFVDAIKVAGQNLLTIINDILDYSKIASGKIIFEQVPISTRKIFDSLQILLSPKASEKNLVLTFSVDPRVPEHVIGDPTRLTQILSNLTDNALKFTEKGSVAVSVQVKSETDDSITLEFCIKDTGAGIPEEKLAAIFERFTQASAETTRRFGGTGLGLSIVKSLVEMQKGHTAVSSKVNVGSVFSFVITYQKTKMGPVIAAAATEAEQEGAKRKLRLLLAEDNQLNQMLVMHFSRTYGYQTDVADNGKIAVDKLREQHYDLVLMDMQMPEMDGYEATTVIRNELRSAIPIIALTAHAMSGEKEKCLGLGMNDFISKPFDPKDLHKKIMVFFNN